MVKKSSANTSKSVEFMHALERTVVLPTDPYITTRHGSDSGGGGRNHWALPAMPGKPCLNVVDVVHKGTVILKQGIHQGVATKLEVHNLKKKTFYAVTLLVLFPGNTWTQ